MAPQAVLEPLNLCDSWDVKILEVPQQDGGVDCGVYACQFAKRLALGLDILPWLPNECADIRRMMVMELVDGRLRSPWG